MTVLKLVKTYLEDFQKELFQKITNLLKDKKNLIITGVPGTGKTHIVKEYVKKRFKENYEFIQFHPSYSYEEFIEGFFPKEGESGLLSFKLKQDF